MDITSCPTGKITKRETATPSQSTCPSKNCIKCVDSITCNIYVTVDVGYVSKTSGSSYLFATMPKATASVTSYEPADCSTILYGTSTCDATVTNNVTFPDSGCNGGVVTVTGENATYSTNPNCSGMNTNSMISVNGVPTSASLTGRMSCSNSETQFNANWYYTFN